MLSGTATTKAEAAQSPSDILASTTAAWTFDIDAASSHGPGIGGASTGTTDIFPLGSQDGSDYYSFDGLDFLLDIDPLPMPTFQFTSVVTTEQPMPFFSPPSDNDTDIDDGEQAGNHTDSLQNTKPADGARSFSQLGSRLPSLQPEDHTEGVAEAQDPAPTNQLNNTLANFYVSHHRAENSDDLDLPSKHIFDITSEDRHFLQKAIGPFINVIPPGFALPTRLSLGRYIRAYVDGFHDHLPFLHIPSMRIGKDGCSVELVLAMAAVGAQYCFEAEQGLGLFHTARAIAIERIRRRDARVAHSQRLPSGPLGLATTSPEAFPSSEDLMQSGQALLILMAMATWARHKEILREALAIQSIVKAHPCLTSCRTRPQYPR